MTVEIATELPCIDRREEVSAIRLNHIINDIRAWTSNSISREDYVATLDQEALNEIESFAEFIDSNPLPLLLRMPDQYSIPALEQTMKHLKTRLINGPGFAVLNRLPMELLGNERAKALYWILSQYVGRPVAQTWNGEVLFDVTDKGVERAIDLRPSYTNDELKFHTDNCFGIALPDYVGLICLQPAKSGGISRIFSCYTIHNMLLDAYPRLLKRLYQPVYFNRQREFEPGDARILYAPVFRWDGHSLNVRVNVNHIRSGYELAEIDMDSETSDAVDALDEVMTNEAIVVEMFLERGELQYLNNRSITHFRSRYEDFNDPQKKRHLIRMWMRETGRPFYNG